MNNQPQAQARDLKRLAQVAGFGALSAAEEKLLQQVPTGYVAVCGPNLNEYDASNDPKDADTWGKTRQIRAALIIWLFANENARRCVHRRGIQVYGAAISGSLDLAFLNMPFPLALERCRFVHIDLTNAEIPAVDFSRSFLGTLSGEGITVKNALFLRGTIATGTIHVAHAQIGSDLDCTGAILGSESTYALNAAEISVKGNVFLRNGFISKSKVHLGRAQIGGDLDCRGGNFSDPSGYAVDGDSIKVIGNVSFTDGWDANSKKVPFIAKGLVNLNHARIGGELACAGGMFCNPTDVALFAERIAVRESVFLRDGFTADGIVDLYGAQIDGTLDCRAGDFRKATLVLQDASAGILSDSGVNDIPSGSTADDPPTLWPQPGKLLLDGFSYGRISSPGRTSSGRINVDKRIEWLGLSPFSPRPYLQLAKVLQESGDSDGALRVLEKMEDLRRSSEEEGPFGRLWSLVLKGSIGYGYYPHRALVCSVGLTALGWIIYRRSYLAGTMAPTDEEAYKDFKAKSEVLTHYPNFSPFVYSVENSLPLVKLGQADKWQPDPEVTPPPNKPTPKLGRRGTWAWPPDKVQSAWRALFRGLTAIWCRVPKRFRSVCSWIVAKLERLLVHLGLRPETDPLRPTLFLSRFATSPRFVLWFLWIHILLGLAAGHAVCRGRKRNSAQRVVRQTTSKTASTTPEYLDNPFGSQRPSPHYS